MTTLFLPFPPSVNRIWLARRFGKSGKPTMYPNPKYQAWKNAAEGCFLEQKRKCGSAIKGKFIAFLVFDEKKRKSNTDLDNRIKAILDALQRFELIENDSLLDKIDASWGPVDGVMVRLFPA